MLTVQALIEYLTYALANDRIKPDYQVAVWVDDQGGYCAVTLDLDNRKPDVDNEEGYVAFHQMYL